MKTEKLSEIEFYNTPTKYVSGKIDATGIVTAINICALSGRTANELYVIGDTEENDFDYEYMEALEEIFDEGDEIAREELEFNEGDEDVVEPGITYIKVVDTEIGRIVKVWSESMHGEFATYFGDDEAAYAVDQGITTENEDDAEYPEVTLTLSSETVKKIVELWETDVDDVQESLQEEIEEVVLKHIGIQF